jgi:hypothetical protein
MKKIKGPIPDTHLEQLWVLRNYAGVVIRVFESKAEMDEYVEMINKIKNEKEKK